MDDVMGLLWRLQSLDREHARCLKGRESAPGPEQREELSRQAAKARERARGLHEQLGRDRSAFRQVELDLRAAEERLSVSETRLYGGGVTNAKELSQLSHRVEEERATRAALEERYLALMDRIERDERENAEAKAAADLADAALAEHDAAQSERIAREACADQDYEEQRRVLLDQIPEPYRDRYLRVHARHPGSALVRVERGNCGGCHTSLAKAEIERAARTPALTSCESCGRLLALAASEG